MSTFYAISGIGYGKGSTPDEARAVHRHYVLAARPSWLAKDAWSARIDEDDLQPTVFRAPRGINGFSLSSGTEVAWTKDGSFVRRATAEDRADSDPV